MRDHLRELVRGLDPLAGRNILREYLQARMLEGLQRAGAMSALAFQGGTALRFLYGLPRYSEDLDFALEGARESYDLKAWMTGIARQFEREGYDVTGSLRDRSAVHSGWLRFRAVLHDVGLSPHRDEVLGIKLDVDTRPPAGAVTETRLVRRHVSLRLHHHDRASLLAGKLHAMLRRPWTKGRDVFDLGWYLSDRGGRNRIWRC
ncbi:MAG: nucleotidyl transferase AbiEii/AbiGii toxin family protein [Gemmatimonadota bacterium]|nr:nucleotidyl transferase AbiEii/AbiGii toxin family protein [Gemmatimonadota bacterium]